MDMYPKYKSALGYQVGDNGIDSYGVNHNNFTLRDEIEYQMARDNREQQMINSYNQQGINRNYPQAGIGFWGDSAENNYGFGGSNIGGNIESVTNRLGNNFNNQPNSGTINNNTMTGQPNSYLQNSGNVFANNTIVSSPTSLLDNNQNGSILQQFQQLYRDKYGIQNPPFSQFTQNTITPTKTDAENFSNSIERDVDYYFNRDKSDLCKDEGGFVPYAYLDTAEPTNTTIGCGINMDQTPDIQLYHAQTGEPFSKEELQEAIKKLKQEVPGKLHTYYEDKSDIRIAPEENERIMKSKYVDGYNYVTSNYTGFPNYSADRQRALMNMVYGLGTPRFSKYKNMRDAILRNDWQRAANEAWRCGVGIERNQKTVNQMYPGLDIDKMKKEHCQNGKKK